MSVGTAITAAVIGTTGAIVSAKIGADASSNAAKTQATAGTNAAQTFQPYQAGAMNAYNKAAAMFGLPPQPVPGAPGTPGAPNTWMGPGNVTGPQGQNLNSGTFMVPPGTGPQYPVPTGAAAGFQAPAAYSLASFQPPGAKPTTGSSFGS